MNEKMEDKATRLFKEGYSLYQLRRALFPELYIDTGGMDKKILNGKRAESTKTILSILGFKGRDELERKLWEFRRENLSEAEKTADEWQDDLKSQRILELFESGAKLREIRTDVFPDWFTPDNPKHEIYHNKKVADGIIRKVLDCKDWDEYNRKRQQMRARLRYRKKKQEGKLADNKALRAALERDGHRCVITGSNKNPNVHHIDGDTSNNDLSNLVTFSKEVHRAIHNGARAFAGKDLEYWKEQKPEYVTDLTRRLELMEKYVEHLHKKGYEKASVECIPGHVLFGTDLCKKLNISPVQKRRRGSYRVVVLQPTGFHEEPKEYEKPQWVKEKEELDKWVEEWEV